MALVRAMLDAEDVGERRLEPALGDSRGEPLSYGGSAKATSYACCVERSDEAQRVGAMNDGRVARAERVDVRAQ